MDGKANEHPSSPGSLARLDAVIADYLDAMRSGPTPDRKDFIDRNPEIAGDLEAFFKDEDLLTGLDRQLHPLQGDGIPGGCPRRFGDYELLEEVARGGMGVVYKARQTSLDRVVALKLVLDGRIASPSEKRRFQGEAEAVASLEHPNIVPIHEIGEQDGLCYFTMRFLDGGSLAHCLARYKASPRLAAEVLCKTARAVHHAHQRGILHRDLKPGNVLLDAAGEPYVADFGLAKRAQAQASLTLSGTPVGTPAYMSPEQAEGRKGEVTVAADVYSLGAILYELLTGQPPFGGTSSAEILRKVIEEDPAPPSRAAPGLPRDLETIAFKCLAKSPASRYASAADLADDLERFLTGKPILARPATSWERVWKWCRRRPAAAALLAVSVLAAGALAGGGLWYEAQLRDAVKTARLRAEDAEAAAAFSHRLLHAATMNLALDAWDDAQVRSVSRHLASLIPAPGEEDLRSFEWYWLSGLLENDQRVWRGSGMQFLLLSADGGTLATVEGQKVVRLWDASTLQPKRVVTRHPTSNTPGAALSRDGKRYAASDGDTNNIFLWDTASGELVTILWVIGGHALLAFLPDGASLVACSMNGEAVVADVATGKVTELFTISPYFESLALSPDGRLLACGDGAGIVRLWDLAAGQAKATLKAHDGIAGALAFSPDGSLLATGGADESVCLFKVSTAELLRTFPGHRGEVLAVTFLPSGLTLATAAEDGLVKAWNLANGALDFELKGHTGGITSLGVLPDGKTLVTASGDQTVRFWSLPPSEEPFRLEEHKDIVRTVAFNPDGKSFLSADDGYLVKAWDLLGGKDEGAGKARLRCRGTFRAPGSGYARGAVSADGRWGAATTREELKIWAISWKDDPARAESETPLPSGGGEWGEVYFSPDSSMLAAREGNSTVGLWGLARRGERDEWIPAGRLSLPRPMVSIEFFPDGKRIAVSLNDGKVTVYDREAASWRSSLEHPAAVQAGAFSRDGSLYAAAGTFWIRIWSLGPSGSAAAPEEWTTITGFSQFVTCVAFSPDQKLLAAGSEDKKVYFWDLVSGPNGHRAISRAVLKGHKGSVNALAFSPDGQMLVTAGGIQRSFGEVLVWRAPRG